MYIYGTSTLPLAFSLAAGLLRTVAASTAGTAAARAALEAERVAARQAQADRRERLSVVSERPARCWPSWPTAGPISIRPCSAAARWRRPTAPADRGVRRRAGPAAARAASLRRHRGAQRPAGELVAVGTSPPLPVEVRRRLAEPLTATLAAAQQWARVTVVAQPEEVIVSLITPGTATDPAGTPPSRMDDGEVEYVYERDEELVWAQTRWRAP